MTSPPHRNQTISFLSRRFAEVGIRPDARRGQNFLIDLNLLRILVDAAELEPDDVVLEVGGGTGSLTALVAERAAAVVTVEIDAALAQLHREELVGATNVTLLEQDALKNKNQLAPEVLAAVREALATPGRHFKLVANLPYNVATPVISNLLAGEPVPDLMVVTIQKELADRITARPSTKDYSALSLWVQCQCEVEVVRLLPPTVFWPRPKVESAILRIVVDRQRRAQIADLEFFHRFVRAVFLHRRKFLRGVLLAAFKQLSKPQVDAIMTRLGLGSDARAEQLDVATMQTLAEAVAAELAASEPAV